MYGVLSDLMNSAPDVMVTDSSHWPNDTVFYIWRMISTPYKREYWRYGVLARKPIDVYQGLARCDLSRGASKRIESLVNRFSDCRFAGEELHTHLSRFLSLCSKLVAYLDTRDSTTISDLTQSIDVLDYFLSTNKWWRMNRTSPSFIIRPPSRDPRDFLKSLGSVKMGSSALGRIDGAAERLSRFLRQHNFPDKDRKGLCGMVISSWAILCAASARSKGKTRVNEEDFEIAYDLVRILLFHICKEEFVALTAVRRIGTNEWLPKTAEVKISSEFEDSLESSQAARFEDKHSELLTQVSSTMPSISRNILTNSLRFLVQFDTAKQAHSRVGSNEYETSIVNAMTLLQKAGMPAEFLKNTSQFERLFNEMDFSEELGHHLSLLSRRLEGLIVDATGNREFLLEHTGLVPRLLSLVFLLSISSMRDEADTFSHSNLKLGLIAVDRLLNEQVS